MGKLRTLASRISRDTHGAEVTELGVVLAMIVAGAVALIMLIGPKIVQFYTSTNDLLP